MANVFDNSAIEEAVGEVLRDAGVSKNVYYNRPSSVKSDLSDFVVCRVVGNVQDLRTHGECTLSVRLFALDAQNFKNRKKLSSMQKKTVESMPRSVENLLIDDTPTVLGDTPDGYGYHVRIINYSLILKSI